MTELLHKTKTSLRVYLERGRAAVNVMETEDDGDLDEVTSALRLRDAAFHNFQALEAMLAQAGVDIAQDQEAQALVAEIHQVNQALKTLLNAAVVKVGRRLGQVRGAQAGARGYRSGLGFDPRLVKKA